MRNSCILLLFVCCICINAQNTVKVNYNIKYGIVQAGTVSFNFGSTQINNHQVGFTKTAMQTTGVLKTFFSVNDKWETYYDKNTALPVQAVLNISEGKTKFINKLSFDQNKLTLHASLKDTLIKLEEPTYDIFSVLYFFQIYDLKSSDVGKVFDLPCLYNNEFFRMKAKYGGIETITINDKKYRCHKIIPPEGKSSKNISIWLTDDKNKLPVLILLKLPIVNLKMEMDTHSKLPYPLATN